MPPPSVRLDAIPLPALLYDAGGRIAAVNDHAEAVAGGPLDGLSSADLGARFAVRHRDGRALGPDELPAVRALAGEQIIDAPLTITAGDGRTLHLLVTASPIRDGDAIAGAISVWRDVSRRYRVEAALREREVRQAFLLALGDRLREAGDPREIMAVASEMVGRHLGANGVAYCEVDATGECATVRADWNDGTVPSVARWFRMDDFGIGDLYRRGGIRRTSDVTADLGEDAAREHCALGIRASLGVPIMRGGRLSAVLAVHSRRPRDWTDAEAELVREAGGRIWSAVERAKADEALRESEERHASLLVLSDALRPLADPGEIQAVAARVLGERLGADRVAYFEMDGDEYVIERDYTRSVPSIVGRHPVDSFGSRLLAEYRAGTTAVSDDTQADPDLTPEERASFAAVGTRAYIGVSLVKAGAFVAGLAVHAFAPRTWSAGEIALVEVTAERTWAAVERARAEAALRESEAKYRSLFDSLDAGFCIIEVLFDEAGTPVDYVFLEANPAFVHQTGLTDAIGRRMRDLNPAHEEHWFRIYGEIATTGEARRFVESAALIGGWYEVYAFPIGEPGTNRVAVLFTDITERTRAEAALKEHAENLRRSNEDLERFAYVASHDLQEPLRSIVSFSQLLERRYKGNLDQDADDYIEFIVEGGNRMQGLIQDLLAYSRVNTTRQQIERTDAVNALARARRSLGPQLPEAGATLTHDPLPVVMADPAQLEQVFAHLLSNAIKFRRPEVPLRIHVGARRTDGFWEFSVRDNGIGIEPEYHDRIFVIFQRLHTKDRYPGTGIGLAIVKRIIDRHGGTVRVESTPGEGSTFLFTLPAV